MVDANDMGEIVQVVSNVQAVEEASKADTDVPKSVNVVELESTPFATK